VAETRRLRLADEVFSTATRRHFRRVHTRLTRQINYPQSVQCQRAGRNNGPDHTLCQFCGLSVNGADTAAFQ
jgi:hypothetical protein